MDAMMFLGIFEAIGGRNSTVKYIRCFIEDSVYAIDTTGLQWKMWKSHVVFLLETFDPGMAL